MPAVTDWVKVVSMSLQKHRSAVGRAVPVSAALGEPREALTPLLSVGALDARPTARAAHRHPVVPPPSSETGLEEEKASSPTSHHRHFSISQSNRGKGEKQTERDGDREGGPRLL